MTNALCDSISQAVKARQHEILQFLADIVSAESITGNEAAVQKIIAARLERMGIEPDMWDLDARELAAHPAYIASHAPYAGRPNLAARLKGEGGGKSLLFNGHVDTIPFGLEDAWHTPPGKAVTQDGKMYGRGTSDMKSGVAAMTMAVEILRDLGIRLKGDVVFQYVVDEEQTGNGTLAAIMRGYTADAAVCCESSSMHVQPACIGRVWFTITFRTKEAGIQRRYEGVNAIEKAQRIIQAVADLEAIRIASLSHPLYPHLLSSLPCMVTMIEAGSFPSAFPDSCKLQGSFATLPGEKTDDVKKDLIRQIHTACSTDPWLKDHLPEIVFDGYCGEAASIPVEDPIVQLVRSNFAKVVGREPEITGRQGAADIRYLINDAKIPTLIFGPGLTEQMHATNEYVNCIDVIHATEIMARTIVDWCGVAD